MSMHGPTRRQVLQRAAVATGAIILPWPRHAAARTDAAVAPLRFGMIADVHQDIMHDGEVRLRAFIDRMKEARVEFIVQLGDFCVPIPANRPFMEIWNDFAGPRYHVLGNHDMDGFGERRGSYAFSPQETMEFWNMPSRYYAFNAGGARFIVLDGNERDPGQKSGYYQYIGEKQTEWLRRELAAGDDPTILFIHQSLARDDGVTNRAAIRDLLERANRQAGFRKVVACFCGHHHRDEYREINGIAYPHVNSASYVWVGAEHRRKRYDEEIHRRRPYLESTAPYRDPLWAIVTIDRERGFLSIEGTSSQFVAPSPQEMGIVSDKEDNKAFSPVISDQRFSFD